MVCSNYLCAILFENIYSRIYVFSDYSMVDPFLQVVNFVNRSGKSNFCRLNSSTEQTRKKKFDLSSIYDNSSFIFAKI